MSQLKGLTRLTKQVMLELILNEFIRLIDPTQLETPIQITIPIYVIR